MKPQQQKTFAKWALIPALLVLSINSCIALGIESSAIPVDQQAEAIPDKLEITDRINRKSGTYGPVPLQANSSEPIPFGAHLFGGGFRGVRADGMNSNYRVVPGDQVTLRIWGAVEISRVLPVDAQGNIFIPSVGPVQVNGVTHSQLDATVRAAVKTVYPKQVQVYTNLQGIQPVAVFVTGYVSNPGRYAGTPNDSALYFLDQAGGIDSLLGSYRNVRIVRNGELIAQADLYDFLLNGKLPRPQFQDGDTLIVDPQGPVITVTGDVERSYRYELPAAQLSGSKLLQLARLKADVSHVLLRGSRDQGPISVYYPLNDFPQIALSDGDEVLFSADQRDETIVVQLEGSYYGPSRYALPKDARLQDLLNSVAVPKELTEVSSVSIRRLSVAARQKESLTESLRRLENSYLTAASSTPDEAQIRVREAELIQTFVSRAARVQPIGRMVVANKGEIANIRLQDGDVITLPERPDSLLISGEVLVPQSVIYSAGQNASDYINRAGGLSAQADVERILVVRLNGEVRQASEITLKPGDEILVLPKVPTKNLQMAVSITQIMYQIAVAARVVVGL